MSPAQKLAQIAVELPESQVDHLLSYAEFLLAQSEASEARWDSLFEQTTDEQFDRLIAAGMAGEATDIVIEDGIMKPA